MALPPIRSDTRANWTSTNPVLVKGETAFVSDTGLMKIGDGTRTFNNLMNNSQNIDVNIVDFGAKSDFTGANTGTNCIPAVDSAVKEARTLHPTYSKTFVLPSGNFKRTADPFFIPNNCFTNQEYGNSLTADITVGGTGPGGTAPYNIPMVISDPDKKDGNLLYKTFSDGASRNMEYTGRVISGLVNRGTQNGNLGGANGTAMNMFDIRYDNAYIGNKTAVTVDSVAVGGTTLNVTMSGLAREGQPIIFNNYIDGDKIVAGRTYYVNSASGSPSTTTITVRNTLLNAAPVIITNTRGSAIGSGDSLTGYTLSGSGTMTINGNTANSSNMTFTGTTPVVGQPITFRANITRAIVAGVTYFVNSVSGTTITVRRSRTGNDLVVFSATPTLNVTADLGTIVTVSAMEMAASDITISTLPTTSIPAGTRLVFDSPINDLFLSDFKYYVITATGSPTTTITISRTPTQASITGLASGVLTDTTANVWTAESDDFIHALQGRIILNNREAGGGRIATSGYVQQDVITSTGPLNRNYVGCGGFGITSTGDGGTDLTVANSKGAYFGGNFIAKATGGTNMFNLCGAEFNAENVAGATSRYVSGVACVGAVSQAGDKLTAAYTAAGLSEGGTTHLGWMHGLCFTDLNGRDAMRADGTLIGTYLENSTGFRRTIANVIDVSTFRPTNSVITTPNMTLTESQLTLGVPQGSTTSTITTNGQNYVSGTASTYGATGTNNNGATGADAGIRIQAKGTGRVTLTDGGGSGSSVDRLFVNDVNGITIIPKLNPSIIIAPGELCISMNTAETLLTFTYKARSTGNPVRTGTITLA